MDHSPLVGVAKTVKRYTFFTMGPFPGMADEEGDEQVIGECYKVDRNIIASNDIFECVPWMYRRKQIDIMVGFKAGYLGKKLKAHAYFMQPPHFNHGIPCSSPWKPDDKINTGYGYGKG